MQAYFSLPKAQARLVELDFARCRLINYLTKLKLDIPLVIMRLKFILPAILASAIPVLPQFTAPALAQVRSNCNVEVIGRVRGSQVNMRTGPGIYYRVDSYVLVGQYVNLLNYRNGDRVSDTDGQFTWYMVEYIPSRTRGWIREDFLSPVCG